jgi:hypothetical protein
VLLQDIVTVVCWNFLFCDFIELCDRHLGAVLQKCWIDFAIASEDFMYLFSNLQDRHHLPMAKLLNGCHCRRILVDWDATFPIDLVVGTDNESIDWLALNLTLFTVLLRAVADPKREMFVRYRCPVDNCVGLTPQFSKCKGWSIDTWRSFEGMRVSDLCLVLRH